MEKYENMSCIVFNTYSSFDKEVLSTVVPTALLFDFQIFDKIYLTDDNISNSIDEILTDGNCTDVIVYVPTDTTWLYGYDGDEFSNKLISNSEKLNNYEFIQNASFGKFYYFY